MNLAIADLGLNNMSSIKRAISRCTENAIQLDLYEVGESRDIDLVILPGVGHFGAASRALEERNLRKLILNLHDRSVPILGICLGLHLLFTTSEESPQAKGLGIVAGEVKKLIPKRGAPVPNVGWCETWFNHINNVSEVQGDYYFTHSYYPVPDDSGCVFSTSLHGDERFTSGVIFDGIIGLQFHPEKSGEVGHKLLSFLVSYLTDSR